MPQEILDLRLTDEDYWTNPFKTRVEIETELLDEERAALVVGAPSTISLQNRDTFPLLVLRTDTLDAMSRLPFRRNAVVVAVELENNTTYADMAISTDIVEPAPYEGPPLQGMGGEGYLIDVRKRLELPWKRGSYLVSLILRDQMSNRVRVELKKGGYQDPAVDEFLEQTKHVPEPLSVWPPEGSPPADAQGNDDIAEALPSYREHEKSPPIPSTPGIALVADRVVPMGAGMRCVLRGSFRLTAKARHVVDPSTVPDGATPPTFTAIVPVTLLLTGSDRAAPYLFPLRLPTFDSVPRDGNNHEVTGFFSVDLCELGEIAAMEQTYFIYAFSGEAMAGPVPMALVTR
jgi:hypothetical protein